MSYLLFLLGVAVGALLPWVAKWLRDTVEFKSHMKFELGPIATYQLVYVRRSVQLHRPSRNGKLYFEEDGVGRGVLIRSTGGATTMYHKPELFLFWKWENRS